MNRIPARVWAIACAAVLCSVLSGCASSHEFTTVDRDRVKRMLREVTGDVKEHYYDRRFHGVDLDAKVQQARDRIDKAESLDEALSEVAAVLDALGDSHTVFLPPRHAYRHDYGFRARMVGERCLVTDVRPGSDAQAKGLKPGEEIVGINGYRVRRKTLDKIEYIYGALRPQAALRLVVNDLRGVEREILVQAQARRFIGGGRNGIADLRDLLFDADDEAHRSSAQIYDLHGGLAVVRLPNFEWVDESLGRLVKKLGTFDAIVLDLRGNPGGEADSLKQLAGYFLGQERKIGDEVHRDKTEPMKSVVPDGARFEGKLVVLVDSRSASSAEVFARVVQLEKRGLVVGDRTAGAVMIAVEHEHRIVGVDRMVTYAALVTRADLVMADGRSLEGAGVVPDEVVLPTAEDVANGRDPVLSRAVELAGGEISPSSAGKLFPFEWPGL